MDKPVLLDGAFGTCIWAEAAKRGIAQIPTWRYNLENPGLVSDVIKSYADAGSEIILSNTFVASRPFLEHEGAEDKLSEVIKKGIEIIKDSADVQVAYSMGPLPKMLEPYGNLSEAEARDIYQECMDIAITKDPDYILLETYTDLNMLEIAASVAAETKIPLICCLSFGESRKTLLGDSVSDMIARIKKYNPCAVGMNCTVGPDSACNIINEFADNTDIDLWVKPNATGFSAKEFAEGLSPILGNVSYIGACCGSNPDYIAELKRLIESSR